MKMLQGSYAKSRQYIKKHCYSQYFDFSFPYVSEESLFREINRFNDESKQLTCFKNRYTGPFVVDISEWCVNSVNSYFKAFLYFILDKTKENKENVLIITSEKEYPYEIINIIEELFEKIHVINLGVKTTEKNPIGFVLCEDNSKEQRCV